LLFDLFIEDFFSIENAGVLAVQNESIFEPELRTQRAVAFRFAVPAAYQGVNPLTLRLFLRRNGAAAPAAGSLEFFMYAKRLVDGSGVIEDYLPAAGREIIVDPAGSATEFKVVDLPINSAAPPNGLGGAAVASGQFLAFELAHDADDGAPYIVLGAEIFESIAPQPLSGATIVP